MQRELPNLEIALHYLRKCTPQEREIALDFINNNTIVEPQVLQKNGIPTVRELLNYLQAKHNATVIKRIARNNCLTPGKS